MTSIPTIEYYPMPTIEDLPASTARWTIEPDRAVLLIHDMQHYFLQFFPHEASPYADLVPNAVALQRRCAALGIPVAYTAQPGDMSERQRGLLKDFWGPGMRRDPADSRIIEPLEPRADDWVLTKWRYSAFHRTDLLARLRETGRDQLLLCGVYAHVGVLVSAIDAFSNDIQPFLVADAIADFTMADHHFALEYTARRCGVVTTTNLALSSLVTSDVAAG